MWQIRIKILMKVDVNYIINVFIYVYIVKY